MKKTVKLLLLSGLVMLWLVIGSTRVVATHDNNLICADCHVMHGQAGSAQGNYLLRDGDQSDAEINSNDNCLSCHDGTDTDAPDVYTDATDTPGGDFDQLQAGAGGSNRGHDMKATATSVTAWVDAPTGDGGTNAVTSFRCASCHDPHFDYTASPRLLKTGAQMGEGAAAVPVATYITVSPETARVAESDTNRNWYKSGYSEWCANCHTGLDNDDGSSGDYHHPAGNTNASGELTGTIATNYGANYDYAVPYEDATDGATNASATYGPTGVLNVTNTDEYVMCLTCHKPHATGNDYIGRWNLTGGQVDKAANTGTCNYCHAK